MTIPDDLIEAANDIRKLRERLLFDADGDDVDKLLPAPANHHFLSCLGHLEVARCEMELVYFHAMRDLANRQLGKKG